MTRIRVPVLIAAILIAGRSAAAQQVVSTPISAPRPDFVVKTVALHHLTSGEAMRLLMPYVQTNGGGVFEVSPNVRAVTIREVAKIYTEMLVVLSQYDREPATVTLSFQLVSAENSGTRDPGVAGLDSLLRGVLKFTGYRLLTTSVASASENGHVSQTLSADGEPFTLAVDVTDLRVDGNDASVHLNVSLWRAAMPSKGQVPIQVLMTGVTVPIGQTVVLGTSTTDNGQGRALILTVRPQLAAPKR